MPHPSNPSHREVLDKYWVPGHNQRLKASGLALDTIDLDKDYLRYYHADRSHD
jgi:hypothetical protein